MNRNRRFCAFILTAGRPSKVLTYSLLRRRGYTGAIRLIVGDDDEKKHEYISRYGDEVVVFRKHDISPIFDIGDNFRDLNTVVYARNATFCIAKEHGFTHFIQLDDDYSGFEYRFDSTLDYDPLRLKNLDAVFSALLDFCDASGVDSLAIAQGGDFIGGGNGSNALKIRLLRKCMNSFICSTARPFSFVGRMNDDVNTYVSLGSVGKLFVTTTQISLVQKQTQTNSGGLTEMYAKHGTYVKSFYTLLWQPSSVIIKMLNSKNRRLHHQVNWSKTVPKIVREYVRVTA